MARSGNYAAYAAKVDRIRQAAKEQMAELVANGMTVAEACVAIGYSQSGGRKLFTEIKRGLGAQAR